METAIKTQVKAGDLRLGNWLYTEKAIGEGTTRITRGGRYIQVDEILQDGIGLTNNDGAAEYKWTDLQPIPITLELLEKCGFERDKDGDFIKVISEFDQTLCVILKRKACMYWDAAASEAVMLFFPKHLHQLQNLYFALTGKELEIKI